jgi:hypothetical protein
MIITCFLFGNEIFEKLKGYLIEAKNELNK